MEKGRLKFILIFILFFLSLTHTLFSDQLEIIDSIVEQLGRYITNKIADETDNIIVVDDFAVDFSDKNPLGQRIKSLLELYLANHYTKTAIKTSYRGKGLFKIKGEIQLYNDKVRFIVRIFDNQGTLLGGTYIDREETGLFKSMLFPFPDEEENNPQYSTEEDPFEPDDNPGFEVELDTAGKNIFQRSITIDDVDRFILQLTESKTMHLTIETDINLQAILFKENETYPIAASEESDTNRGVSLNIKLPPGVYIIVVQSILPGIEGNYKLTATFENTTGEETGENLGNITPNIPFSRTISPGETQLMEISGDNLSFYLLSATANGRIKITFLKPKEIKKELFHIEPDNKSESPTERNYLSNSIYKLYSLFFIKDKNIPIRLTNLTEGKSVDYTIKVKRITPPRIFPNNRVSFTKRETPVFIILRIIEKNEYTFRIEDINVYDFQILSLPDMKSINYTQAKENNYSSLLDSGDYIIRLNPTGNNVNFQLTIKPTGGS